MYSMESAAGSSKLAKAKGVNLPIYDRLTTRSVTSIPAFTLYLVYDGADSLY